MLKALFLFVLIAITTFSKAQHNSTNTDTIPQFLIGSTLPSFTIQKIFKPDKKNEKNNEGELYTEKNLPSDKKVLLIYFSPECSHCQYEAETFAKAADSLSDFHLVWMSYSYNNEQLWKFSEKYGLLNKPNFVVGKLTTYQLPSFYKIAFTPYMAIYNLQHQFVTEFRKGATIQNIVSSVP